MTVEERAYWEGFPEVGCVGELLSLKRLARIGGAAVLPWLTAIGACVLLYLLFLFSC